MDICPCYSVENKKASQSEKKGTSYLKFLKNLDQAIIFWTIYPPVEGVYLLKVALGVNMQSFVCGQFVFWP